MAYRLELLTPMKVHLLYHISFLKLYEESSILGKTQPLLPCIEIDTHEEFGVEKVLDS